MRITFYAQQQPAAACVSQLLMPLMPERRIGRPHFSFDAISHFMRNAALMGCHCCPLTDTCHIMLNILAASGGFSTESLARHITPILRKSAMFLL